MQKLFYAESEIGIKKCFTRQFTLAIGVISTLIPHWIAAVGIRSNRIGYIR